MQKLCATHKNKIPCCESSQIDGLEAGKITFQDYHLIWWAKVGFTKQLTNWDIHIHIFYLSPLPYPSALTTIFVLFYFAIMIDIAKMKIDTVYKVHHGYVRLQSSLCSWGKISTDDGTKMDVGLKIFKFSD